MNLVTIIRHAKEENDIACQHLIGTMKGQTPAIRPPQCCGVNGARKKYFAWEGAFGSRDAFIIIENRIYQNGL
jgi:hypothetical protein